MQAPHNHRKNTKNTTAAEAARRIAHITLRALAYLTTAVPLFLAGCQTPGGDRSACAVEYSDAMRDRVKALIAGRQGDPYAGRLDVNTPDAGRIRGDEIRWMFVQKNEGQSILDVPVFLVFAKECGAKIVEAKWWG